MFTYDQKERIFHQTDTLVFLLEYLKANPLTMFINQNVLNLIVNPSSIIYDSQTSFQNPSDPHNQGCCNSILPLHRGPERLTFLSLWGLWYGMGDWET